MKTSSCFSKGFSLMEVLISVFIFSVIMVAVTSYFASTAVANQNTKRLQRNLEDARFALNRIAKVLRTSVAISTAGSPVTTVRVYDYSQSECVQYQFINSGIREYEAALPSGESDEKAWCTGNSSFTSSDIMSTSNGAALTGMFSVTPSNPAVAGRITITATVTRQTNASTIQTTVSLRNYKEVSP